MGAAEEEAWNMPDMDSIKSAMYNNAYMIRTAMSDMMEGSMFPKGVEGPIRLIGNQEFSSEEEPEFLSSLAAFTWFSYRQGFTGIPDISYDTGWGCVHRAGQMLLMIALTRHLGCDRAKLLSHFRDVPSAGFSIQAIATHGRTYGKQPGQWFAPSTIAHVIKDLLAEQVDRGFLQAAPLRTVVVTDQQVKCKQVLSQAASSGILMLIPFMFGIDTVNASNERLLLSILHSRYCVGILGGRPRHALYFIGSRANHLIYLDPHRVQPAFTEQANIGVLEEPKRRSVCTTDIDPCSLIAFYTRDTRETAELLRFLKEARFDTAGYPIFDMKGYAAIQDQVSQATGVPSAPPAPPGMMQSGGLAGSNPALDSLASVKYPSIPLPLS